MDKQAGAANTLPGYTGFRPSHIREEAEAYRVKEMTIRQKEENATVQSRVPGYQGYVPQIKSENVFGNTFGTTTRVQKEGAIQAGFD